LEYRQASVSKVVGENGRAIGYDFCPVLLWPILYYCNIDLFYLTN